MRSYACWIATLWHDTYAVWDSSAFRESFISFFYRCRLLFVWLVCPSTGSRVLGLQWYFIPRSRHCGLIATQSEIPLLLEHVLSVRFFATHVLFDVFVFLPVVFVLQWYARSRYLVGQRWCLTWCLVIFVLLQCYMRSYACWIATLTWYPFSLIFLPFLSSFNSFIETLPVLFYLTIWFFLSPCSWYHSGVFVRNPCLVIVDVWDDVR